VRGNVCGAGRRVAADDQREVQRPVHSGEQPPHCGPRRLVRGPVPQDGLHAAQDQSLRNHWRPAFLLLLAPSASSRILSIPSLAQFCPVVAVLWAMSLAAALSIRVRITKPVC
jgi:hypothetical protein